MRMLVVRQDTDCQKLIERLVRRKADSAAPLEALQKLNPHVDFSRLSAGTVLLVPDSDDFAQDETDAITGEAFAGFSQELRAGLNSASERVRSAYDRVERDQKDVVAATKRASVKRLIDSDPALRQHLADSEARSKAVALTGKQLRSALDGMDKALNGQLEQLKRLVP